MKKILIILTMFMLIAMLSAVEWTVSLVDSYGDGWNGGALTVNLNGSPVLTNITLPSGAGPLVFPFEVTNGDQLTTVYTPGSWAYENEYYIYDHNANLIASDGTGGVQPTGILNPITVVAPVGFPATPNTPFPVNNASILTSDLTLTWNFGVDTVTYDLWFGLSGAMTQVVTGATANATGSYYYNGLVTNNNYQWQVIAHNANRATTNGPVWNFTTTPIVNMTNGSMLVPAGMVVNFYDSGGATGTYQVSENYTYTFTAPAGYRVNAEFQIFYTESGYDYLYVYDGPNASSPLLGTFHGTGFLPGPFTSSHATGALTFVFASDTSVQYDGWHALVGVEEIPAVPIPVVTPGTLAFGTVSQNIQNGPQNVTITNTGGSDLVVAEGDFAFVGTNPTQFNFSSVNLPATIGTGGSVIIPVYMYATQEGYLEAILRYTFGGVNYDVALNGTALSNNPEFAYAPTSLAFGGGIQNVMNGPRNVQITNAAGGVLNLTSANFSIIGTNPDQFSYSVANLPANLGYQQSVNIPVYFTPTTEGLKEAILRISYGRTDYDVALSGTGLPLGTVIIGDGAVAMNANPINPYYGYTYSQQIYLQSEIQTANQRIEQVSFYWNGLTAGTLSNDWVIYMGHTAQTDFASSTAWIPLASLTQVFAGTVELPAVAGWINIPLTVPFNYNNTSNLVIAVDENEPDYDGSTCKFLGTANAAYRSLAYYSDTTNPDPAVPPAGNQWQTAFPNVKLLFGDLPVGSPGHVTLTSPDNGATMIDPTNTVLSWTDDMNTAPAVSYQIFVGADPIDPANEYYGEFYYETSGRGSFVLSDEEDIELAYNSRWYWAVLPVGADASTPDLLDEDFMVYNFRIQPPPAEIAVLPLSLTSTVDFGETDVQNITITNDGGLPLNFSIGLVEDTRASQIVPFDPANQRVLNLNAAQYADVAPFIGPITEETNRAIFDVQFNYPTFNNNGEYGVAFDGTYFYTSDWSGAEFYKYDASGNYVGAITVPGYPGNIRDLTYDGQYFYGSPASTTIYQLDLTNGVLIGTITSPVATRGIAYDSDADAFWVGNQWTTDMRKIDRAGNTLQTLTLAEGSCAGLAYDNVSGPTPTLWGYTQSGLANNRVVQYDITTGAVLQSYDLANSAIGLGASNAGGFEIVTGLVPGYASLVGNIQNVSIWGLELCTTSNWAVPNPRTGTVAAGQSMQVAVTFDGINNPPGEYAGNLVISNNAGAPVNVALDFTVEGEWLPIFQVTPTAWNYGDVEQLNSSTKQFTISNPGGDTFTIADGGIYLSGDVEGNYALNTAGLPVTLAHGESYNFTATFTPVTTGYKTATLNIVDNLRETHTVALEGTGVEEAIGQIVNLTAVPIANENIQLNWANVYGFDGEPGWISYDDGSNNDGIGTGGVANFNVAAKFFTDQMAPYAGMDLTMINFFPKSANTNYTLKVWTGSNANLAPTTLVYEQAVVAPVIDQWNEVVLTTPIPISGTDAVWIGYNVDVLAADPFMYFPAGSDAGPAVAGLGDLIEFGGSWVSMYTAYGLNYNWNLQGYVATPVLANQRPQLLNIAVNSIPTREVNLRDVRFATQSGNTSQRVLQGYNVYRDNVMINAGLVNTNSYLDVNPGVGNYSYTVQGIYFTGNTAMSSPATASITPPVPYELPFLEDWASGNFTTNQWTPGATNWSVTAGTGNPVPSAMFNYSPVVTNYSLPLTSYLFNGVGLSNLMVQFDLSLNNYSTAAENLMSLQVEDGRTWQTVATFSSFDNDGLGWGFTTFFYDISAYASNRVFKIRFLAHGEDSYEINYWYLDNIIVRAVVEPGVPANLAIAQGPGAAQVTLSWDAVNNALWYGIYGGSDPYSMTYLGWWDDVTLTLPASDMGFFKVTAGDGGTPRGQRISPVLPAKRK
jgi:hypothetical protein